MEKELLEELKNTKYQLDQYRLLTNKLINQNVSQYNIDKFVEKEYIQNIYKKIQDYEYDLYNWLSPDLLDVVSNELISLETQLKKQKEVIDRILNETKETRNILNNNRDDNMLSKSCLLSYLEIVEDLLKEVSK